MSGTLLSSADSASAVLDLAGHGDAIAVRTGSQALTYAQLRDRAAAVSRRLGAGRRLVLLECRNDLDTLIALVAVLQYGHVAILAPAGRDHRDLISAYDPDVVAGTRPDAGTGRDSQASTQPSTHPSTHPSTRPSTQPWTLTERRDGTVHDLHPDLALLLSTSGSTGSPKLVRLSAENLRANAVAIADYLRLDAQDRAITTLPMHYCYGLSVITSHLHVGASITLTENSVVDSCFWELAADHGVTTMAGVPYTFELLERSGRHRLSDRLPTLRQVTQAGGRLAPARIRDWARRGRSEGWELVVMYGQTEATARMAYLPPTLTESRPEAIGVPIPGGALRVDAPGADGVGELVYSGPNVMMGYAETPADLGDGSELAELRTGDLAREVDGLFEVVGRMGRHAKLFGLRLDLERIERRVGETLGQPVHVVAGERALHLFGERDRVVRRAVWLRGEVAQAAGIPPAAVRVRGLDVIPRTASGKPDLAALLRQAAAAEADELDAERGIEGPESAKSAGSEGAEGATRDRRSTGISELTDAVIADAALVLGRPDAGPYDTFVGLGGDSLSYVELATRLGRRLGDLPEDWHTTPFAELATAAAATAAADGSPGRGTRVDTSVLLRAIAIVSVVGTHANLFTLTGGAHLLLALAGFNLARFQFASAERRTRVRNALGGLGRLAVPSVLWIGGVALISGMYDWQTVLLVNEFRLTDFWTAQWQFWFLETVLWTTVVLTALLAIGPLHRLERRHPFGVALGLLGLTLAVRYAWVGVEAGPLNRYTIVAILWVIALGWCVARASSRSERLVVSALAVGSTYGFFGEPWREAVIVGGLLLMIWVPTLRLSRPVAATASTLASASLFIYLTHWQVYPRWEDTVPWFATLASLAVGVAAWWGWTRLDRDLVRGPFRGLVRGTGRWRSRRAGQRPPRAHLARG